MKLMTKITTVFRSRARQNAELFIDANAIGIFEQELLDSQDSIADAKRQLTLLMAERLQLERDNQDLNVKVSIREQQVAEALTKDSTDLASALAEDIVDIEQILSEQTVVLQRLIAREEKIKTDIQTNVKRMGHYQRELHAVKATQRAQKAMESVSSHFAEPNEVNLNESLTRIKNRQQWVDDQQTAGEQLAQNLASGGLEQQLKDAGIVSNKKKLDAVLNRIKATVPAQGL